MKRALIFLLFVTASLLLAPSVRAAGIADTYHNLMPGSPVGTAKGALNEICVYCHTPHAGTTPATDDGTNGRAPLWNRQDSAATYTLYTSPTFDSTIGQPKSVSKACLSCHDGTLAFNALRNLPGSGRDGSGGDTLPVGSGNKIDPSNQSNHLSLIASDAASLTNDHPIGMTYADTSGGPKSPGLGTNNIGENSFSSGFRPKTARGSTGFYFVDASTAANGAPTFTNIELPLYGTNSTVECASCHDPHEQRTKNIDTGNGSQVFFLRASNENSQICRTCHLK